NLTGADVPLHDNEPTPNPWKFTDGVDFTFPAGAYVPAYGYALVVGVTEAEFRAAYPGLPAGVPVFGPYAGVLDNAGETIELSKPGSPEPGTGFVPYIRAERVTYDDSYPWPVEPDGRGAALNRWVAPDYGNDPANWATSTYGGTPGAENVGVDTTAPSVPTDLQATALSASEIQLTWTASVDPQTGVSGYRVYRDGIPIGTAAGTVYVDANASTARTYAYQVSALNLDDIESPRSEPPLEIRILAIGGLSTPSTTTVSVRFTETVTRTSAELKSHYTLTAAGGGTIAVTGAVLQPNNTTVLLTVDTVMAEGVEYTLAVEGVVALTGIEILPNSHIVFGYYVAGSGTILREYWLGIPGDAVSALTGNVNYPDNPTGSDELSLFETPGNGSWADSYGTRLRGYLSPPITGEYIFWISSDDNSELWLSSDEDPGNKVRIAYVPGWTGVRQWNVFAEQKSAPIILQVGRRYYVEAIHKEGGGGDNLAVKWQMPDATEEAPIPGLRLSPYIVTDKPTVDLQVVDADAAEAGRDPGAFWVTRTGDTAEPLTVHYTVGGTATSDDYQETLTGVVVIGAGADHAVLTVTPVSDTDVGERDETVALTLTLGEYRIGTGSGAVTIANNPAAATDATVSILQIDRNASEPGTDRGTLWVMRVVGDTTEPLTVYYALSGTAAPADYQETLAGQVVIPAGLKYAVVTITPVDDAEVETDETVTLTLLPGVGYVTGIRAGTVTIHDNDVAAAPPAVVAVELNGRAGRSTSAIEPGGIGVETVTVTFSEAVVFDASAVVVRKVTFDGETEVPGDLVTPANVAGSGSAVMTLTFDT
ncbi:MAG: hypothetical protein IMZ66_08080, partial [Planctomycetes bacterium]|nr:hypothetical protein [Planctomycetota bacterium]